jgi:hypothetical protein
MKYDDLIQHYADGGPVLVYATAGIPEEHLRKRIGPGEWSVAEVIGHIVDSDLTASDRMKRVIAEENPLLVNCEETLWVQSLDYPNTPVDETVALFAANRRLTARVLRTLPEEAFARKGTHTVDGSTTLAGIVKKYIGHLDLHLRFLYGKRENLGCPVEPRYSAQ